MSGPTEKDRWIKNGGPLCTRLTNSTSKYYDRRICNAVARFQDEDGNPVCGRHTPPRE